MKRTEKSFNSTFKPRTTGLANGGRLPTASAKGRAEKAEMHKAYAAAPDAGQQWCSACGKAGPVEHSHILSQGNHARHRANPLNWLQFGKWCGCHRLWEDNKAGFAARYPAVFAEKMRRMKLLDAQAYAFFMMKNPTLAGY
jgi:hypothetical protein